MICRAVRSATSDNATITNGARSSASANRSLRSGEAIAWGRPRALARTATMPGTDRTRSCVSDGCEDRFLDFWRLIFPGFFTWTAPGPSPTLAGCKQQPSERLAQQED